MHNLIYRPQRAFRFLPTFCLLLVLVGTVAVAEVLPKLTTILPSASPAVSDDALATYFNPAALGFRKTFNAHYLRTYEGVSSKDDALFLGWNGSTFSMEFAETDDIRFSRYTLGDGFRVSRSLFLGSSYSWYTSDDPDYDDLAIWQVGALYRKRYLSLGAVARNLNRPSFRGDSIPRQYDVGVALRPATNVFTLSMDARKQEDVSGLDWSWALEVRPVSSLFVRGSIHEDKRFDVHFGWNLAQLGFSGYNRFDEDQAHQDGVVQFSYSAVPYNQPQRKRLLLEVTPAQISPVLSRAASDPKVVGAILKLDNSNLGFGTLQEAHDALREFQAQGKVLISYARHYTTGTYMLASTCDRILVHPSGEVRLLGIRAEALFAQSLLNKLGVHADIERIGEYKSAAEQFTRDEMSEPFREAEDAVLDDLYAQLVARIAEGRGWSADQVRERIDGGPYSALDAQLEGLADQLAYEDQIEAVAHELGGPRCSQVAAAEYATQHVYRRDWSGPRPQIALIRAKGMMNTGKSFRDPFTGTRVMGSKTIAEALQHARTEPRIKAIVLRIDSGGGLVLASDIIWHELMLTRERKPVIVSMGDVAASGGYYIAAPAHHIIAEPATITGSIGVISGKYGLKGFYDKIGVHKTILKRGANADFYSDYEEYTPIQRERVKHQVRRFYNDFVHKVAEGRSMEFDAVDAVAQGRIWTGKQALEHGLIDELGGMTLAIQRAKERAGFEPTTEMEFVVLPQVGWFDQLLSGLTDRMVAQVVSGTGNLVQTMESIADSPLAITPYQISLDD